MEGKGREGREREALKCLGRGGVAVKGLKFYVCYLAVGSFAKLMQ